MHLQSLLYHFCLCYSFLFIPLKAAGDMWPSVILNQITVLYAFWMRIFCGFCTSLKMYFTFQYNKMHLKTTVDLYSTMQDRLE